MADHTVRPLAEMKWETFTFLSHGGMPLFVDTPEDDGLTLDPVAYDRMGRVFKEARQKEELFGHEHLPQVGLYFSAKTRDWYGRQNAELYFKSFMGAHQVLVESHIPVEFLFDETISLQNLKRYPVIFLANTAILDQREIDLIGQYVQEGGRLLATFETSRFDVDGKERREFGLSEVLGVNYDRKTEFKANYFRVPKGLLSEALPPDWDILILGPNNVVRASGEESLGELKIAFHDRGLTTHMGHAPHNSPWKAVGPALVKHRYGQGATIYVSFSPEAAYLGDYPLPEHRLFVRELVRLLSPPVPVSIEAPLTVESVITHDPKNRHYLVHLIRFEEPALPGSSDPLYRYPGWTRADLARSADGGPPHAAAPDTLYGGREFLQGQCHGQRPHQERPRAGNGQPGDREGEQGRSFQPGNPRRRDYSLLVYRFIKTCSHYVIKASNFFQR
jgi:hypothetical protein